MRPVERGPCPVDERGESREFADYAHARPYLLERLGSYCSYCEMPLGAGLATEHVRAKDPNPGLERDWSNFLLACTNCNSHKGTMVDTQADVDTHLWPHMHRSFEAFEYREGGRVRVAKLDDPKLRAQAESTNKLVQLDLLPNKMTAEQRRRGSDRRWEQRRNAWDAANEARADLWDDDSQRNRARILREAASTGFWSVWLTVFADHPQMVEALCAGEAHRFPGTARERVLPLPPRFTCDHETGPGWRTMASLDSTDSGDDLAR